MRLTIEIAPELLSHDPIYCENFEAEFRCFYHMGNGGNDVPGYRCEYYNVLLKDDSTYQNLRCEECKNER
jgi:hypothetical protein